MLNGEVSAREFWLVEPFVAFEGLVQLFSKCFVRWSWKHTTKNKHENLKISKDMHMQIPLHILYRKIFNAKVVSVW